MDEPVVDATTVRHVADLAYVEIDDDDIDRYADQFEEILSWFEALETVPEVEDVDELTNVLRPDEIAPSLDREEALANAGDRVDDYFKGPPVG